MVEDRSGVVAHCEDVASTTQNPVRISPVERVSVNACLSLGQSSTATWDPDWIPKHHLVSVRPQRGRRRRRRARRALFVGYAPRLPPSASTQALKELIGTEEFRTIRRLLPSLLHEGAKTQHNGRGLDKTFLRYVRSFLSHKAANKLMHVLHGNICAELVAKWVGRVGVRTQRARRWARAMASIPMPSLPSIGLRGVACVGVTTYHALGAENIYLLFILILLMALPFMLLGVFYNLRTPNRSTMCGIANSVARHPVECVALTNAIAHTTVGKLLLAYASYYCMAATIRRCDFESESFSWSERRAGRGSRRRKGVVDINDGYCYLRLFARHRWASVAFVLGKNPRCSAVLRASPDYKLSTILKREQSRQYHVETSRYDSSRRDTVLEHLARTGGRLGDARLVCNDCGKIMAQGGSWDMRIRGESLQCDTCLSACHVKSDVSVYACHACGEECEVSHSGVSANTAANRCPFCEQLWGVGDHAYANCTKVVAGDDDISVMTNCLVAGEIGERMEPHGRWEMDWSRLVVTDNWTSYPNDRFYRDDDSAGGLRDISFRTLHNLASKVLTSTLSVVPDTDPRRARLWDQTVARWQRVIHAASPGTVAVVTACNSNGIMQGQHPSCVVSDATVGYCFVATIDPQYQVSPDWVIILIPLRADEGRLLASLRVIPAIAGRTDMDFYIVNGCVGQHPTQELRQIRESGLGYGSACYNFLPTNLGAQFVNGCIFRADRKEIRSGFIQYGNVYGWDESVFYVRSPTMWFVKGEHKGNVGALSEGAVWPNLTVLENWDYNHMTGHHYDNFSLAHVDEVSNQDFSSSSGDTIMPTVNSGHCSLEWALQTVRNHCRINGIPYIGDASTPRQSRVGYRWLRYHTKLPANRGQNDFGAIWRARDFAHGLRLRLDNSITQSLNPLLWAECHKIGPVFQEATSVYDRLKRTLPVIRQWADGKPGVICVAAVMNREHADSFIKARGKCFEYWIFLSENPGDSNATQLWVTLPVTYGCGNIFQLSRLLPAASGANAVFSVLNDLETDWLPREERLATGIDMLKYERIVFPAMMLNSPCPFQDATFYGDALVNKREELLWSIANWGWVYGFDEVWAGSMKLPTALVGEHDMPGGAATTNYRNPEDALLYTSVRGQWRKAVIPHGAFLNARDASSHDVASMTLWERFKRAFGLDYRPGRYLEFEPEEWATAGERMQSRLSSSAIIFITWGTYGDRIPIVAAAKAVHRLTGGDVIVRHMVSLEEGKRLLALCEQDKAYLFFGDLISAVLSLERMTGNLVAPDHMVWGSSALPYSLRPGDADAAPPGGGFPYWVDWLVQLVYWKTRARVRIGLYKGLKWFPRSADGVSFLYMIPCRPSDSDGKRGVCIGSSSLSVPDEYHDWDRVPDGDHYRIAQEYTTIVCDGGAGKVQTFRAAGVPNIVSTNNKIDRKYLNPADCGAGCTGNEPDEKWALVSAYFNPSHMRHYAGVYPWRWITSIVWVYSLDTASSRIWLAAFFLYCVRGEHVMPSVESTIAHALAFLPNNPVLKTVCLWTISFCLRSYATWTGKPLLLILWEAGRGLLVGAFSSTTTTLISLGWSAKRAILIGSIVSRIRPSAVSSRVNFFTPLNTESTGVWLIMNPVWVSWVPVGLHVGYYVPSEAAVYEGVYSHGSKHEPGAPFKMAKRTLTAAKPFVAVKSTLHPSDLELDDVPRPYSAIHNCQTLLLTLFLRHGKSLMALEVLLLLTGSAWAFVLLLVSSVFLVMAASSTALVAFAVTPLDDFFPEWQLSEKIHRLAASFRQNLFWFAADEEENHETVENVPEEFLRDLAASAAADAIRSGIDETTVFEGMAEALVKALYDADPDLDPSSTVAASLFEERRGPSSLVDNAFASWVNNFAMALRHATFIPSEVTEGAAAYLGAMLEWSENATIEVIAGLCSILDWLEEHGVHTNASLLAASLSQRLAAVTDSSTRRKNVWALLSKKRIERLRRADWLALSLKPLETVYDGPNPAGWLAEMLSKHHATDSLEEEYIYRFPSWLPKNPRASAMEYEYPSLLHEAASALIDPELTERVMRYVSLGGEVGIDGMWVATDENRERVTSRYFSEPNPLQPDDLEFADELARALFSLHPEAFEAPAIVRPETVRQRLNMRGRSGVPFLQKVRSRRALESTGWMKAIISATYECIETGQYPPDAMTEFAKMMVLPADKLVSKGPRTIIATSLLNSFVNNVYELERRTRKVWPTTNMGMGAPLTARYMGEVFEKIKSRNVVFAADMTAFDANVPPVIFEILARLGELGAKDLPVVGASLRTKYRNLQNSHIYDLPSGKVWVKRRGGATGQSATSWDNSWAMRAIMIAVWSYVTNKPFERFYETNTVHNSGDDNIWGTDDDLEPQALAAAAMELFGMELRVEPNFSYLSKVAVPGDSVAGEVLRVLDYVPNWVAVHDTARLLSRRGAVVSHASGRPYREYKRHLSERAIGHAQLCAHNRPLYNLLANEWMEDTRRFIGARNYAVVYDITRDEVGDIELVVPRFVKNYVPTPEQQTRLREATKGGLKFPSYQRVLEIAYTSKEVPEISKYAKVAVKPSLEAVVREYLVQTRIGIHSFIPDALVKLSPSPTAAPYAPIFISQGYAVEKFVWRSMAQDVSLAEFAAELRQAPWAVTTDPTGFWWYLDTAGGKDNVLKEHIFVTRGRMVFITGVYAFLTEGLHWLRASRIGLFIEAFQIYTQDAPRLFALLDSLHWLETSRSSPVISSLTPKDPYATQKKLATSFLWACPNALAAILGTFPTIGAFAAISELIARIRIARIGAGLDTALGGERKPNRWVAYAREMLEELGPNRTIAVSAPTSTGKSTELPARLIEEVKGRVWLVVHTRYLRDTYSNPWVSSQNIVKLSSGIIDRGEKLAVCTYGHICARQSAGQGPTEDDVVLFDEFHERKPIQGIASEVVGATCPRVYLTATPDWFYTPPDTPWKQVPIEREWREATPVRLDLEPMALYNEAKLAGADVSRCLFIVPSVREVEQVVLALQSMGESATGVTAKRRLMPTYGHIVGTSVVEAGVNISPPATCLIDSGLRVVNDRGRVSTRPSPPDRARQALGRVARRGVGEAYVHSRSGTGDTPTEYPTYLDLIAASHHREWLLNKLGLADHMQFMPGHSNVDPHMRIVNGEFMNRDIKRALEAWWLLCASARSPTGANRLYDLVVMSGWPEELDSVSNILGRARWLPPRSEIQSVLDASPFQINWDGTYVRPMIIDLIDDQMRWA